MVVVPELEGGRRRWRRGLRLAGLVWCLGGMCGLCGCDLEVLQVELGSFFQDKGPSVGGERNKLRLSPRLAVFQFLENQGGCGLFGL